MLLLNDANIYAKYVSNVKLSHLLFSFNNRDKGLTAFCYQCDDVEKKKTQKNVDNVKTDGKMLHNDWPESKKRVEGMTVS